MVFQVKFVSTSEKRGILGFTTTDTTVTGFMEIIDGILDPVFWTVDLANCTGHVTVLAKVGKEIGQTVRIGATETVVPMVVTVLPRQKRNATRGTDRVLGDGILKSDTFGG